MNKSNINALNDTNLVSPHQLILPLNYITVIKEPTPRKPSFFIIPFPPRKAVVLTKNISVGLFLEALRLFVFLEALRLFTFLHYLLSFQPFLKKFPELLFIQSRSSICWMAQCSLYIDTIVTKCKTCFLSHSNDLSLRK